MKCIKHPNVELEDVDCFRCRGEGMIEQESFDEVEIVPCWQCGGTGRLIKLMCPQCEEEYQEMFE